MDPSGLVYLIFGRADVLQHPPMAGGAAYSIQVYTQILAKPKQQGKGAVLPDSTLQLPLYAPDENKIAGLGKPARAYKDEIRSPRMGEKGGTKRSKHTFLKRESFIHLGPA